MISALAIICLRKQNNVGKNMKPAVMATQEWSFNKRTKLLQYYIVFGL